MTRRRENQVSSFVRGGQTLAHAWAMFLQVVRVLAVSSLTVSAIIIGVGLWQDVTAHEWYWGFVHLHAQTLLDLGYPLDKVRQVEISPGSYREVELGTIVQNPAIVTIRNGVEAKLSGWAQRAGYGAAGVCAIGILLFWLRGRMLAKPQHVRGSTIVDQQVAAKLIDRANKKSMGQGWRQQYRLAGVPYPHRAEASGTILSGAPGSGKTQIIHALLEQIIANGDRAIVYDKMQAFTQVHFDPSRDTIFNPFDVRSKGWDLFDEVAFQPDLDTIANAYIPKNTGGENAIWAMGANIIFRNIALRLLAHGQATLKNLVDTLLRLSMEDMAAMVAGTTAASLLDAKAGRTAANFKVMITAYFEPLLLLPTEGERFSIRQWIKNDVGSGLLFLTSSGALQATMAPLIRTWIELACLEILSLTQSRQRRIWLILDELPDLGQVPMLPQILAQGRQFGFCGVIGLQVYSQLEKAYGKEDAKTLSGLCRSRMIFATPDADTAEWASKQVGEQEETDYSVNLQYGASQMRDGVSMAERRERRPLVLPTSVMDLPDLTGFLRMPQGFPVCQIKIAYKQRPANVPGFVQRPMPFLDPALSKGAIIDVGALGRPEVSTAPAETDSADHDEDGVVDTGKPDDPLDLDQVI